MEIIEKGLKDFDSEIIISSIIKKGRYYIAEITNIRDINISLLNKLKIENYHVIMVWEELVIDNSFKGKVYFTNENFK